MKKEMKKNLQVRCRKKSRMAIMMIIILIMQIFIPTEGVFAKDVNPTVEIKRGEMTVEFTGISIKEGDKDSQEVGVNANDPIKARIGYNIFYYLNLQNSDKADLTSPSAIELQIPQEFVIQAATIPIYVDDGGASVHIANCDVKADGRASLEFLGTIKDYEDITDMYFSIGCAVNEVLVDSEGERPVDFIIGGATTTPKLYFKPYEKPVVIPVPAVIEKTPDGGWGDETKAYWKISIKEAGTQNLVGAEIVDVLDKENLEFIGMRDASKNKVDSSAYSYNAGTGELRYTLPGTLDASALPYEVYVETKLTDKVFETTENRKTINIINTAHLEDITLVNPIISNEATASMDVKVEWISKTGTPGKIGSDTVINWTVIVNKNNRDVKNAVIFDEIPKGLELIESSVKIQEVADGSTLSSLTVTADEADLDGLNYFYEKVNEIPNSFDGTTKTIGKLKYKFPGSADNVSYQLTYSTKVVQSDIHDSNNQIIFKNYAGLGWGNTHKYFDYKGVGIATNMLAKSGDYSRRTQRITWAVTVNANKINMTQAIVTDDIELGSANPKQKLVLGTVKLDGVPLTAGVEYKNGILTCDLGNIGTNTHKLTFETEVTNPEHYATNHANVSYANQAKVDGQKDGTIGLPTSKASANVNVGSEVIKKSGKGYDYTTREVTWEIVINQNRMPITTAMVEDTIPEGQEYVPGSFKLLKYDGASHANKAEDYETVGTLSVPSEADHPQLLRYAFNSEIDEMYTLEFKTKLTEEYANELFAGTESNQKKYVKNNAILSGGAIPTPGEAAEGSQEIKHAVVTKEGQQIGGADGPISWEIVVNPNQIELTDAIIEDKLASGLDLDIHSIVLNEINVDGNGVQTIGNKVPFNAKESIIYSNTENKLEFKLPSPTNKCYKLTFSTDIDAKNGATFDNTVKFSGKGIKNGESAQKKQVRVQMSGSGGVASKRPGIINILKKDATDPTNKKPLQGAIFEVVDDLGIVIASGTTDAEGKAKLAKLKLGVEYTVREKEAPAGYTKRDKEEKVTFDVLNKEKTITFDNVATSRTLQFKKVSDTNQPIHGATFSLYAKTDTTFSTVLATAESTEQGDVVFNNITFGNYQLKETITPTGYIPSTQVYQVAVEKDGTVTLSKKDDPTNAPITQITNNIIKGSIELKKVGEGLQPLEHAEFGLFSAPYVQGAHAIQKRESNAEGIVLFEDVPYGEYVIKETKAPTKHKLNDTEFKVNITSAVKVVLAAVKNELKDDCRVEVNKVDEKGNPLEGAEFTLFDAQGNVTKTVVSGLDGIALFEKVKYGMYVLKETKAPKYYALSDEINSITIDSEVAQSITIKNVRKQDGRLEITKVNKQQIPLQGAEFALFDLEGNNIQVAISDKHGMALFENVPYGKYTLKETKAPKGYKLNKEVEEVEIISDEAITLTIINQKESTDDHPNDNNQGGSNGGGGGGSQGKTPKDEHVERLEDLPKEDTKDIAQMIRELGKKIGAGDKVIIYDEKGNIAYEGIADEEGKLAAQNLKDDNYTIKIIKADGKEGAIQIQTEKLPQAGTLVDTKVLVLAGFLFVLMGIGYNAKTKSKKS